MKPAPFEYQRARSIDEAVDLLSAAGEDGKAIAGGQSLLPLMNLRLATPGVLVDVARIDALRVVDVGESTIRIGSAVTHYELECGSVSATARAAMPVLAQTARMIGHLPIRSRGTIGGSLAHADPLAEWCLIATMYDARLHLAGPRGARTVHMADFGDGPMMTCLAPDDLLVSIELPLLRGGTAITEFARRQGDFAVVSAATHLTIDDGTITSAAVALGGVSSVPVRARAVESALLGQRISDAVLKDATDQLADDIEPSADLHGSADYRRHLAAVLVRRALRQSWKRATGVST